MEKPELTQQLERLGREVKKAEEIEEQTNAVVREGLKPYGKIMTLYRNNKVLCREILPNVADDVRETLKSIFDFTDCD